jgi:hypothetical protein
MKAMSNLPRSSPGIGSSSTRGNHYLAHTAQSLGHLLPALSRVGVGLNDVLLGLHPSLPLLRRGLLLIVRWVHRYYGAVRLLWNAPTRITAFSLFGPVSTWVRPRSSRGLPVLVHVVSQRARVLRLRRADWALAIYRTQLCCLPPPRMRSASLIASFRSSIARPTDAPVYASTGTSRPPSQNSGSGWIRCSFPVGLFHPLQHAGLSRRTPGGRRKPPHYLTAVVLKTPGVGESGEGTGECALGPTLLLTAQETPSLHRR